MFQNNKCIYYCPDEHQLEKDKERKKRINYGNELLRQIEQNKKRKQEEKIKSRQESLRNLEQNQIQKPQINIIEKNTNIYPNYQRSRNKYTHYNSHYKTLKTSLDNPLVNYKLTESFLEISNDFQPAKNNINTNNNFDNNNNNNYPFYKKIKLYDSPYKNMNINNNTPLIRNFSNYNNNDNNNSNNLINNGISVMDNNINFHTPIKIKNRYPSENSNNISPSPLKINYNIERNFNNNSNNTNGNYNNIFKNNLACTNNVLMSEINLQSLFRNFVEEQIKTINNYEANIEQIFYDQYTNSNNIPFLYNCLNQEKKNAIQSIKNEQRKLKNELGFFPMENNYNYKIEQLFNKILDKKISNYSNFKQINDYSYLNKLIYNDNQNDYMNQLKFKSKYENNLQNSIPYFNNLDNENQNTLRSYSKLVQIKDNSNNEENNFLETWREKLNSNIPKNEYYTKKNKIFSESEINYNSSEIRKNKIKNNTNISKLPKLNIKSIPTNQIFKDIKNISITDIKNKNKNIFRKNTKISSGNNNTLYSHNSNEVTFQRKNKSFNKKTSFSDKLNTTSKKETSKKSTSKKEKYKITKSYKKTTSQILDDNNKISQKFKKDNFIPIQNTLYQTTKGDNKKLPKIKNKNSKGLLLKKTDSFMKNAEKNLIMTKNENEILNLNKSVNIITNNTKISKSDIEIKNLNDKNFADKIGPKRVETNIEDNIKFE